MVGGYTQNAESQDTDKVVSKMSFNIKTPYKMAQENISFRESKK